MTKRPLTSWPVSSTQSLEHRLLASISTLNMVQTDGGRRRWAELLTFCSRLSNAALVLSDRETGQELYRNLSSHWSITGYWTDDRPKPEERNKEGGAKDQRGEGVATFLVCVFSMMVVDAKLMLG